MSLYDKFEELVDEAIIDGFYSGLDAFMESVEDDLMNLIMIEESGGIEGAVESVVEESNTLKRILKRRGR